MASETALQFTCEWAYQNERNEWIETDHSLTETYLSSRSEISMELLKMAGIRLAEILNNIGKLYATRKHELAEGRRAMKIGSESVAPTSNRYLVIEMSMIPDEHLFNEEVDENDDEDLESIKVSPKLKEEEPVRKAETGKVSRSTKRKLRKKRAKYMFEGVDLESVVLIKRRGKFVLTGAKLAKAAWFSYTSTVEVTVRFADGNEEVFAFDSTHFGFRRFSDALITAALMRIKNVPLDSITLPETPLIPENPVSSIELTRHYIAPFEGQIEGKDNWQLIYSALPLAQIPEPVVVLSKSAKEKAQQKRKKDLKDWEMILGHVPTEGELSALRVQQNFNDICFFRVGMVFLSIHRKNIEDPSRPMVKTNEFYFNFLDENNEEVKATFLVDNDIVDGDLYLWSNTIHLILQALEKNNETCKPYFEKQPTLEKEFAEVTSLMYEKDYKRSTLISHIKYFTVYCLDALKYRKVHWSIHPASADGKIL
jgi:hypothetical protein